MWFEDSCPEEFQKYNTDQKWIHHMHKYEQYKDVIDQVCVDENW